MSLLMLSQPHLSIDLRRLASLAWRQVLGKVLPQDLNIFKSAPGTHFAKLKHLVLKCHHDFHLY